MKTNLCRASGMLAVLFLAVVSATAADHEHDLLVLTSTNNPTGNEVIVFKLNRSGDALAIVCERIAYGRQWRRQRKRWNPSISG